MRLKGQASVEYLMIISISLLLVFPFIYYGYQYKDDISYTKQAVVVDKTLNTLKQYSDFVFNQGMGAMTTVFIKIPDNIVSVDLGSNYIAMRLNSKYGYNDFVKVFDYNLTGNLPTQPGSYEVKIYATSDGVRYETQ